AQVRHPVILARGLVTAARPRCSMRAAALWAPWCGNRRSGKGRACAMLLKLTILAAMALLATAAHAQRTQNLYDSRGNVAGTAITAGSATTWRRDRAQWSGQGGGADRGGNRPRILLCPFSGGGA